MAPEAVTRHRGRVLSVGRVVVVGSLNVDLTLQVARLPSPGETVVASRTAVSAGGKGGNQAVAAALLGAPVSLVGCVGDDDQGRLALAAAERAGVDVRHVRTTSAPTGQALIAVDEGGENTIVVAPGANLDLRPNDVSAALLSTAAVVCLSLEVPLATIADVARRAKDAGATVVLNLSPSTDVPRELLDAVDVLVVNEHELRALVGRSLSPGAGSDADLVDALRGAGLRRAVVTLGADGAVVVDAAGAPPVVRVPPHVVDAVDTVGSGDAFTGALASELAAGASLADAARTGAVAGALAATRPGAQDSFPSAQEVRDVRTALPAGPPAEGPGAAGTVPRP